MINHDRIYGSFGLYIPLLLFNTNQSNHLLSSPQKAPTEPQIKTTLDQWPPTQINRIVTQIKVTHPHLSLSLSPQRPKSVEQESISNHQLDLSISTLRDFYRTQPLVDFSSNSPMVDGILQLWCWRRLKIQFR